RFKFRLPYPPLSELERLLASTMGVESPTFRPVLAAETAPARVESLKQLVRSVLVAPHIEHYVAGLVRLTLPGPDGDPEVRRWVAFGASPRGGQALLLGAKVHALLDGRPHVAFEDVDRVARSARQPRLAVSVAAEPEGVDPAVVVDRVLAAAARLRR